MACSSARSVIALLTLGCVSIALLLQQALVVRESGQDDVKIVSATRSSRNFEWEQIKPDSSLVWHTCFEAFKCAKVRVPMDWLGTDGEHNKTVDLAVIKLEAAVPVTDIRYGGAIIMSPGGPGLSGVGRMISGGHHLQAIVSTTQPSADANEKYFDIISFDPRNVNNSRPHIVCFANHLESATFRLQQDAYNSLNASSSFLEARWKASQAYAMDCSKRAEAQEFGKHVSTASTARDVVQIIEQHGIWREQHANRILHERTPGTAQTPIEALDRFKYCPGCEPIQFWGFSYGSVLGSIVSAMFPQRVQRMLLDGIMDGVEYMSGQWESSLQDTDLSLHRLAIHCFAHGSQTCALYDTSGPDRIHDKLWTAIYTLERSPIDVPASSDGGPMTVSILDLQHMLSGLLRAPLTGYEVIAAMLEQISRGEGQLLATWKRYLLPRYLGSPISEECALQGPFSWACHKLVATEGDGVESAVPILCSDAAIGTLNENVDFLVYYRRSAEKSRLIGSQWAMIHAPCTAWHAKAAMRYQGNFSNEPLHPVLFVANIWDPVTPLTSAVKMSLRSKGSQVVRQNSEGHCSFASPSMCTGKMVRRYFQQGYIPAANTTCQPDRLPFDGFAHEGAPGLPPNETDLGLWTALTGLNRAWYG